MSTFQATTVQFSSVEDNILIELYIIRCIIVYTAKCVRWIVLYLN